MKPTSTRPSPFRTLVAVALAGSLAAACGDGAPGTDVGAGQASAGAPRVLRVAVAANFARTADAVALAFEAARPGVDVQTSVGSTGALYAQITNGAPFDVLLAADQERPRRLAGEGRAHATASYAIGRLALTGHALDGHALAGAEEVARAALVDLLGSASVTNVAIANPDTAPYGVAALEVLDALGLRAALEPRLAKGTDVGQAHQFAVSGAADLAFVALAQAVAEPSLPHVAIPADMHAPVVMDAAQLSDSEDARAFLAFLTASDEAAALLEASGYARPDAD
jgi:molybdate transport system substrate-binding protein